MTAVYQIKCLANGKVYIGQSKKIKQRFSQHKTELKHGYHQNQYLQSDFNKYGEENFSFEIIEIVKDKDCSRKTLDILEKKYISLFRSNEREHGYNIESGGMLSKDIADETKSKLSIANKGKGKGKVISEKTKELMRKNHSHYWQGKKMSDEAKLNMSNAQRKRTDWRRGFKQSEELIRKRTQCQFGKMWVNNGIESHFIPKCELSDYLDRGYKLGRPFAKRNRRCKDV